MLFLRDTFLRAKPHCFPNQGFLPFLRLELLLTSMQESTNSSNISENIEHILFTFSLFSPVYRLNVTI